MHIKPITAQYDAHIRTIIEAVGAEFGAVGDGFGPSDREVQAMSQHYCIEQGSQYFIAVEHGQIMGGGGIKPFLNSAKTCELCKVFLLPAARGKGAGKKLTQTCLDFARQAGYTQCYLDTLSEMTSAIRLYEHLGFKHRDTPMPGVIHTGCDVWMELTL
ncbi:GNAT family N-acetyltransferase [Vibrio palustris]|uniref:Acetyltransferase (GNAT) family protein n=1 Tax=Vibrio palustris TaxID=1918946 RepID=A0A1R4B245_9VIBR|nr:GNAT family N-acetyltransferase [Vibrio palustris]SJL82984.1 Acetyltransferase (GNAT) family protein [Vibrio palustris]